MADKKHFEFYKYEPSLAAAIVFAVLFLISSVLHTIQLVRTRTWYFTPLVIGGVMEGIGFVGRIMSSRETPKWTLGPFIIQSILLLVAPALFAASIYMVLGRIIIAIDGEGFSVIKRKWLTKLFVAGDILSFLVLSSGAGMLSGGKMANPAVGENIILTGLFIQIITFGTFLVVAIIFHVRMNANPTPKSSHPGTPWQKHLCVLYFVSLLIMIRSVVRVIEYIQGYEGYILSHEIFLYIFDAALMLIAVATFNIVHPSELLPGKKLHDEELHNMERT